MKVNSLNLFTSDFVYIKGEYLFKVFFKQIYLVTRFNSLLSLHYSKADYTDYLGQKSTWIIHSKSKQSPHKVIPMLSLKKNRSFKKM